ncbi:MAG: tRNA pseudouridine(13) synthase TruD [Pseudohongiellaceae bacterium]|jgi:tRNA pseudouridine13 synthase|nr:tRNA pseudouridine(13) synthase TruD [Gammaproteobacteria bacterium]
MSGGESFLPLESQAYVLGRPEHRARIKQQHDDFVVTETLGFEPSGDGEHLMFLVEKSGQSTREAARKISRILDIDERDVGYSGMKDRRARTRQWYSARVGQLNEGASARFEQAGLDILRMARNYRKLRIGSHKSNQFRLLLRGFSGCAQDFERRLQLLEASGVPNYFGSQRFGRELSNLPEALAMLRRPVGQCRTTHKHRESRSIFFSAARAYVFNQLLSRRVRCDHWSTYVEGDVLNLDKTKRFFTVAVDSWNQDLVDRLESLDIHPTGLLPGKPGRNTRYVTRGIAADMESAVCKEFAEIVNGLARWGVEEGRRPLRFRIEGLDWRWLDSETLELSFSLPTGAYATSLLRELCQAEDFSGAEHAQL